MTDNADLYRSLYLIRRFEETVLENFSRGVFYGTTHTYLGQEANAVGVLSNLQPGDITFSTHRCHGHFLANGGSPHALFAELMGKATGVCGGRGGSQHLQWDNFYSNGVQGGTIPIATGMALAEKFKQTGAVTVAFLGDGTLGEGIIYEAFNMASLWEAPILYVLENNRIAQTTPVELAVAGGMAARLAAFNIPVVEINTSDILEILPVAKQNIDAARNKMTPHALIIHTYRFGPHSKGDDTRPPEEIAHLRENHDPVKIHGMRISDDLRQVIEAEINVQILDAFQQASNDPFPV